MVIVSTENRMKGFFKIIINKKIICLLIMPIWLNSQAQEILFEEAKNIGPVINSEAEELSPLITPSGSTIYFSRAFYGGNTGGAYAGMDIWMTSKQKDGRWSKPSNGLKTLNNNQNNAVLGLKSDEKTLYLLNAYNNQKGIAFSRAIGKGWGEPEIIEVPGINKNDFIGFYMSPSYDVLLISMKGEDTLGEEDLYVSTKNRAGKWSKPINMGSTINTSGFEISPFLSKDKKRLFFASNGHGGFGDADIFVSERLYDSWTIWSAPKNLGEKINSQGFDAYLSMADDSTVVFASNREGEMADLYQSKYLGKKNTQMVLKESLIAEAKGILAELRGEKKEYFIAFEDSSSEFSEQGRKSLSDLMKDLNYQYYSEINLFSFKVEDSDTAINNSRINRVLDYLKVSGISENKINVNKDQKLTGEVARAMTQDDQGVLIVISKLN